MAHIMVSGSSSECSACGGNASPWDRLHYHGGPKSGWSECSSLSDRNGCGVEFTHHESVYVHIGTDGKPDFGGSNMREVYRKQFWGE